MFSLKNIRPFKKFYPPRVADKSVINTKRKEIADNYFVCGDCKLKKNKFGLWDMYINVSGFEAGVKNGILTKELAYFQEDSFMKRIKELVPSTFYLKFLRMFVGIFNRNIALHVPDEYKKEIYGVSLSASPDFNFVSKPYFRMLNYHAAHDIGHALQNMNMVYCTAFGVKGDKTDDGKMLIGRNFDLYIGDDFALNKIVTFVNPDKGHKFVSIGWASMIGVISGMNEKGLTITYNSAKSAIPFSAKTPVSILARKILQYASNIDEAYQIAKEYKTFVSGAFFVSSASEKRFVILEKTTKNLDIFESGTDVLIQTNHFQSNKFKNTKLNLKNIEESSSMYRWERTQELINKKQKHSIITVAEMLRDQKGKNDEHIGIGNEKAINQLIGHHSIIFKPEELKFWISSHPYQLGCYVAYDMNKVFDNPEEFGLEIYEESQNIPEDSFMHTEEFINFKDFRTETHRLEKLLKKKNHGITEEHINKYIKSNPNYYQALYVAGLYYKSLGNKEKANELFHNALSRQIPWLSDRRKIENS
ncbi:MAG: hypothetical protein KGZ97_01960 [Bacteroidetes bacterium]|nr:hypothetical protein [Bacteroidota bacterium]